MKNYYNFINESKKDDYEKTFLEISHLDELVIRFDFINYISLYYFYNDKILFRYNKGVKRFYVTDILEKDFINKYVYDTSNFKNIILYNFNNNIKKYFEIEDNIIIDSMNISISNKSELHFKTNIL